MWSQPKASAVEWEAALEKECLTYDNSVITATANVICAARKFNEVFVGGDETPYLVQVLSMGKEGQGEVDIIASVLLPAEEVEIAHTSRGADAASLVASFWARHPHSPALLQSGGIYHRLMCDLPAGGWTQGCLNPAHVRVLQESSAKEAVNSEALRVYVPGQEDAMATRPAIVRPAQCTLEDAALESS